MHTAEEQKVDRDDLLEEIEGENDAPMRKGRPRFTLEIVIRHPDIPEGISIGPWDLHAPLWLILQAIASHVPAFLRHMEARIPDARRGALSPHCSWCALSRAAVAKSCLVCGRWLS